MCALTMKGLIKVPLPISKTKLEYKASVKQRGIEGKMLF